MERFWADSKMSGCEQFCEFGLRQHRRTLLMDRCNMLFQADLLPRLLVGGVLDTVASVTRDVCGNVVLLDEISNRPVLYASSRGKNPHRTFEKDITAVRQITSADSGVGIIRSVLADTGAIILEDVFENGAFVATDPGMRSEACIPLVLRGKTMGALTLESSGPDAFEHEDVTMFNTLASQIAMTIRMRENLAGVAPLRTLRAQ